MGLRIEYLDYIEECSREHVGGFDGRNMLELGNQHISKADGVIKERTGREYYTRLGCHHLAIDLNGEDGALPIDLSQPLDKPEWNNHFDIITNSGTTEHVEPHEAQYDCFANLHNWLRPGGIAVHIVPDIDELNREGRWKNHCNNYYSLKFFEMLAASNHYRLHAPRYLNGLACACLIKDRDLPFMSNRDLFLEHIARRRGGKHYVGINSAGFSKMSALYQKVRDFDRKRRRK